MIRNFDQLLETVRGQPPARVAVAVAQDDAVLKAVAGAKQMGLADFSLVGDAGKIKDLAGQLGIDISVFTIVDEPDDSLAARLAVSLVSGGQADILMKGLLNTADFLRAVLDKEVGLRNGRLLSHVFVVEAKLFDRLLLVSDSAINISPTLDQKAVIVQNCVTLAQVLGISPVRVAVLAAVETVNSEMPATVEAAALAKMADRGQITGALVDGPLALDIAVSVDAARHKGVAGPVAGLADVLLVPDIEAGNILAKSMVYFAGSRIAGLVVGASRPVVLTSRADSFEAKLLSIALAVLAGK